jgi:Na+/H+ antiporter NhaA
LTERGVDASRERHERSRESSFIGLLAFPDPEKQPVLKLAVLVGSLLSALAGAVVLLTNPAGSKA